MPYAEKQDGLGTRLGLVMLLTQLCNPDLLVGYSFFRIDRKLVSFMRMLVSPFMRCLWTHLMRSVRREMSKVSTRKQGKGKSKVCYSTVCEFS